MATSPPSERLDLSRQRGYGELLRTTFELFGRHAQLFLTLALVLVTPVTLLVDGVWGRVLAEGPDAEPRLDAQTVSAGLQVFVIVPLITAANVVILQALAGGTELEMGDALRASARVFPRVVGAVVVYVAAVMVGFVAFVIPGVWLAIRGYFAAQVAVVDGLPPAGAFRGSNALVRGSWWRTFGYLLATGLLLLLGGSVVIGLVGTTGSAPLYVAGLIIVESAVVSLTAIFATLLFFDLRARRERPADALP